MLLIKWTQFICCHLQRIHSALPSSFPAVHPVSVYYSTWTSSTRSSILLFLRCWISGGGRNDFYLSNWLRLFSNIKMRRLQSFVHLISHERFPASWSLFNWFSTALKYSSSCPIDAVDVSPTKSTIAELTAKRRRDDENGSQIPTELPLKKQLRCDCLHRALLILNEKDST